MENMVDVEALIAKARELAEKRETVDVSTLIAGEQVEITFETIDGPRWADLTATHSPREKSNGDANFGFNRAGVVKDYPVSAIRVAGASVSEKTWGALFEVMDGPTINNCSLAVWGLNQYNPETRIRAAKKATAGASKKKQN